MTGPLNLGLIYYRSILLSGIVNSTRVGLSEVGMGIHGYVVLASFQTNG